MLPHGDWCCERLHAGKVIVEPITIICMRDCLSLEMCDLSTGGSVHV